MQVRFLPSLLQALWLQALSAALLCVVPGSLAAVLEPSWRLALWLAASVLVLRGRSRSVAGVVLALAGADYLVELEPVFWGHCASLVVVRAVVVLAAAAAVGAAADRRA